MLPGAFIKKWPLDWKQAQILGKEKPEVKPFGFDLFTILTSLRLLCVEELSAWTGLVWYCLWMVNIGFGHRIPSPIILNQTLKSAEVGITSLHHLLEWLEDEIVRGNDVRNWSQCVVFDFKGLTNNIWRKKRPVIKWSQLGAHTWQGCLVWFPESQSCCCLCLYHLVLLQSGPYKALGMVQGCREKTG